MKICLVAFIFLLTSCSKNITGPEAPADASETISVFSRLLNEHRVKVGCPALVWHEPAAAVALAHSRDMEERKYFSHTNPDGQSPFDRLRSAGVKFFSAAENIARGQQSPEEVFRAWLNSPAHRKNIENCLYTHHALGEHNYHWTHLFLSF